MKKMNLTVIVKAWVEDFSMLENMSAPEMKKTQHSAHESRLQKKHWVPSLKEVQQPMPPLTLKLKPVSVQLKTSNPLCPMSPMKRPNLHSRCHPIVKRCCAHLKKTVKDSYLPSVHIHHNDCIVKWIWTFLCLCLWSLLFL